jgi:predicted metalloprotease with PDZ domain
VRVSPYSTETTFSLTKRETGGFGLGLMESAVTGMMTVNRIAPGGVAEGAGIKEGFVLMKLGGHDLLQGAKSLAAAQEAIQPCDQS